MNKATVDLAIPFSAQLPPKTKKHLHVGCVSV